MTDANFAWSYDEICCFSINPSTPQEHLQWIFENVECCRVLRNIAENRNTPASVLEQLVGHESPEVRAGIGDNPNISQSILEQLVQDECDDVRLALAENHNLPRELLVMLSADDNPWICVRSQRTLERLAADSAPAKKDDDVVDDRRVRLVVAEDNDFMRSMLVRSLAQHPRLKVVADVVDGTNAVKKAIELHPQVVLMDISMPGIDGVEATRLIKSRYPDIRIVMVTGHNSDVEITRSLHAGADGYFLKTSSLAELATCVVQVADGGNWLDPGISATVIKRCIDRYESHTIEVVEAKREGSEHSLALNILDFEIDSLANANKLSEALAVCKSACAIAAAAYGRDSKEVAAYYSRLGQLHYLRQDFKSSEKLLIKGVVNREDALDSADGDMLKVVKYLAKTSELSGHLQQSELYYTWCLRMCERLTDKQQEDEIKNALTSLRSRGGREED